MRPVMAMRITASGRAGGQGFVVAGETAVEHEQAVGSLDRPPFRNRVKPLVY